MRPTAGQVETRAAPVAASAPTVDGRRLHGVIPYGVESRDLGGWVEVIEPGALANTDMAELVATVDHTGIPLARYPGTLEVEDRADGLHWSLEPPQSRAEIREAVERGDLRSTSWRMVVGRDEWRGNVRHVHEVGELRDVSIVTSPAYSEARAEYRAAPEDPPAAEPAEQTADNQPARRPDEESDPQVQTEDRDTRGGGLAVEDRAAASGPTVEERVMDALRSVRRGESRALTTAASVAPAAVGTFLFDKLRAQSVALASGMTVLTTDRDSVVYPSLTADVAPAWYAEASPITPGDPTFATVTATPRKLAHLVQMSNEVIDDSDPSIVEVLNEHLLKVLALKLDIGIFQGSGTAPEIRGLAAVSGIQTVSMGANGAELSNLDPIVDAMGLLAAANTAATAIVMAPRTWSKLAKLKETPTGSNTPLMSVGEGVEEGMPARIFGVPVYVSGQLAVNEAQGTSSNSSSIYVYNAPSVVYVRRTEIELELDRSRLFNSDQSELRAKLRGDLIVPNPTAVVRVVGVL